MKAKWTFAGVSDQEFPEEIKKLDKAPAYLTDAEVLAACAALTKGCENANQGVDYDYKGLWRATAMTPTKCIQFIRADKEAEIYSVAS